MEIIDYKKGIRFECQGSSSCCVSRGMYGFVYLSNKDLKKLSKYFSISNKQFVDKYCDRTDGYLHLKEINKNGNCQFLEGTKCSVYITRPEACRSWPFWKENMKAKIWNKEIVNFCPVTLSIICCTPRSIFAIIIFREPFLYKPTTPRPDTLRTLFISFIAFRGSRMWCKTPIE